MRSIRRSLVIYFLLLMAVALGAVGLVIDRLAQRTLAAREKATHRFIDQRYSELVHEERDKFDADLANLATRIAYDVWIQKEKDNDRQIQFMRLTVIGTLGAGMAPNSWLGVPIWSVMPFNRRANEAVRKSFFSQLHFPDEPGADLVLATVQGPGPGYPDMVYRSRTVENENWDPSVPHLEPNKIHDEKFEPRTLKDGSHVRAVCLQFIQGTRFPRSRPSFNPAPGSRSGNAPRPDSSPRFEPPPEPQPSPTRSTVYIQCARPLAPLENKIAALDLLRDEEKAAETARTVHDRAGLRGWLGLIGVLTFSGLIGGGMLLVRRGLRPLDTLSDAVSKISQKDFLLPFDKAQLSEELLPIHDRLSAVLSQLKRAFEHDKQAVADISHELRTPVAALLATLDVSLRKPRSGEQYHQTLIECRSITKQLQGLVERVMLLASLDAGPRASERSDVDAVELVEGCATVIRPLAEAHGLTLSVNAPSAVSVRTDGEKLREVLMNLLHNAIEYNTPGGRVELSVSNGGPSAVFAVKDTGIGMTDEVKNRIFERFYRADPSRTATGLHAGLGLAIVKECVDRMGGRISVESAPGNGSQFKVELPV